jgi:hypothetical protein
MCKRNLIVKLAVIAVILIIQSPLTVANPGITVDVTPASPQVVPPGIATYSVTVRSDSTEIEKVTLSIVNPRDGWIYLFSQNDFELPSFETINLDLSITVPEGTANGEYFHDVRGFAVVPGFEGVFDEETTFLNVLTIALDKTPPVTTDNSPSDWQNADFTVSLICTDNLGGTGCKETKYRIDGGTEQIGNSISISTEGDHLIEYSSTDNASNQESTKSTHAKLDKNPPATIDNSPSDWQNADFTVSFTCADNSEGSGCKETKYRIDGSTWQTGNSISISTEGDHLIEYSSTDNASNQESTKSTYAKLDKTPPVTTDNSPSDWQNADFTVSLICTDNSEGSGCKETKFRIDSGTDQTGNSISISTEGDHLIEYSSTDNAGNQESTKSTHAKLDKTSPSITINTPLPYGVYPAGISLNYSAIDSLSGIATISGNLTNATGVFQVASGFTPASGVYTLEVKAIDIAGNTATSDPVYFVVYDPNGGFVTGGGWINSPAGAYMADLTLSDRANFGFVSKYKKGAKVPTGETEFQFKVANLNFHSENYEWLVVSGPRAQYKGNGTINGAGNYGFILTAIDGAVKGGGGSDKLRIKIWDKNNGDTIVYDNQLGAGDGVDPTTVIQGGSIVIHV